MLSYQALIINAYTEYQGEYWSGYDRQFRQRAAVIPATSWSSMDTTLWNLRFGGRASLPRYIASAYPTSQGNVNSRLTPTRHQLLTPLEKDRLDVPASVQSALPGMKTLLQVVRVLAAGMSIHVTFVIRMPGYRTKGTKRSIALIMFKTDQKGHKGQ